MKLLLSYYIKQNNAINKNSNALSDKHTLYIPMGYINIDFKNF